jgi:signal peptidase II
VANRRLHQVWISGLVVIVDQIVKVIVRGELDLYGSITVIPGFFDLSRVHNTGAAFGMLNPIDFPYKSVVLAAVAAAALAGLALYSATLGPEQRVTRTGLAFVIGGAAGNLIDRVAYGYVLDFFDFYWGSWHFWAFNVADAAITVGVGLMILDLLGIDRHRASRTA